MQKCSHCSETGTGTWNHCVPLYQFRSLCRSLSPSRAVCIYHERGNCLVLAESPKPTHSRNNGGQSFKKEETPLKLSRWKQHKKALLQHLFGKTWTDNPHTLVAMLMSKRFWKIRFLLKHLTSPNATKYVHVCGVSKERMNTIKPLFV